MTIIKPNLEEKNDLNQIKLLESYNSTKNSYDVEIKKSDEIMSTLIELQNKAKDGDLDSLSKIDQTFKKLHKQHLNEKKAYEKHKIARHYCEKANILEPIVDKNIYSHGSKAISYPIKGVNKISFNTNYTEDVKKELVEQLSSWREESQNHVHELLNKYNKSFKISRDEYIVSLFQDKDYSDWKKDRVYVDLETTGLDPYVGDIIEIGLIRVNSNGKIVHSINKRFNMENSTYRDIVGTGPDWVHHIYSEDIKDLKPFSDPENQKLIAEDLNDPNTVMVAHNDAFENAWLSEKLEGFWEVRNPGSAENILRHLENKNNDSACCTDTSTLSAMLFHDSPNNKLETFTSGNGVPYVHSHAAFFDAKMTWEALKSFSERLKHSEKGVRPKTI